MSKSSRFILPDLSRMSTGRRWFVLVVLTLAATKGLEMAAVPSQHLIGSMIACIFLAVSGAGIDMPRKVFFLAQAFIGCLIGSSVSMELLKDIASNWHLFSAMVLSVAVVCAALGWLLAKSGTLPGTTAIWGTSPGAAMIMVVMSQDYGADSRLVAFMQYLRVVMVTFIATGVVAIWGEHVEVGQTVATVARDLNWVAFSETVILAVFGACLTIFLGITSAAIMVPMLLAPILDIGGIMTVELPWWMIVLSYFVVGWGIGARFDRPIVMHALRALPLIILTMLAIIVVCGILAAAFGHFAGIDPITAYLATSPGGMDAVAILATSIGGNTSLIMAVQTTRFILLNFASPPLAAYVTRKSGLLEKKDSEAS